MPFPRDKVDELLVKCHRRCCICHRFCGTKIETDHIEPRAQCKNDDIENAIPVCFECHAEIHSYNINHPRGRKFKPEELRQHRNQWLKICEDCPEALLSATWDGDVGPLQALLDELEYNRMVASPTAVNERGAIFQDRQFLRAIQEGMISMLEDSLKDSILQAYVCMSRANQHNLADMNQDARTNVVNATGAKADRALLTAKCVIEKAYERLLQFLRTNEAE